MLFEEIFIVDVKDCFDQKCFWNENWISMLVGRRRHHRTIWWTKFDCAKWLNSIDDRFGDNVWIGCMISDCFSFSMSPLLTTHRHSHIIDYSRELS